MITHPTSSATLDRFLTARDLCMIRAACRSYGDIGDAQKRISLEACLRGYALAVESNVAWVHGITHPALAASEFDPLRTFFEPDTAARLERELDRAGGIWLGFVPFMPTRAHEAFLRFAWACIHIHAALLVDAEYRRGLVDSSLRSAAL